MNREVKVEGPTANRVLKGDDLKKLLSVDYDYLSTVRSEWEQPLSAGGRDDPLSGLQ